MAILKKTLFAGLAAITLASAGTAATTTSAEAGYRFNHHYHSNHGCYYKSVWKSNYYGWGHGRWVKVKICY